MRDETRRLGPPPPELTPRGPSLDMLTAIADSMETGSMYDKDFSWDAQAYKYHVTEPGKISIPLDQLRHDALILAITRPRYKQRPKINYHPPDDLFDGILLGWPDTQQLREAGASEQAFFLPKV